MRIELTGTPGGDGECWVMYVDKEQFIKLKGFAAYHDEVALHKEVYEHVKPEEVPPMRLRIYPDDLVKTSKPIRLTLTYEEI
jgi:hypothetical protein